MKNLKYLPLYLVSWIPLWVLYPIADFLYFLTFYVARYRKEVVEENFRNSFPDVSEKELKKYIKGFYHHFCDMMVESIKVLTISRKQISKRFHVENPEVVNKVFDEGKSIVLYTSHMGNWEWFSFLPITCKHKVTTFYKPLRSKYFDDFMKLTRGRFGILLLNFNSGFRDLIQLEKDGVLTMNCIIGDQSPRARSDKYWTTFLNQETAFFVGAERIALKNNQVLFFPQISKPKRGRYRLKFIPVELNSQEKNSAVQNYVEILEKSIRKEPSLWLWSHKRWKHKK